VSHKFDYTITQYSKLRERERERERDKMRKKPWGFDLLSGETLAAWEVAPQIPED
jgi:hypothetical protein